MRALFCWGNPRDQLQLVFVGVPFSCRRDLGEGFDFPSPGIGEGLLFRKDSQIKEAKSGMVSFPENQKVVGLGFPGDAKRTT